MQMLRQHRLLDEQRVQLLDAVQNPPSRGNPDSAVQIDRHIPGITKHRTSSGKTRDDLVDLGKRWRGLDPVARVHLHGGHPGVELCGDLVGDLGRLIPADPRVDPHPIPLQRPRRLGRTDGHLLTLWRASD